MSFSEMRRELVVSGPPLGLVIKELFGYAYGISSSSSISAPVFPDPAGASPAIAHAFDIWLFLLECYNVPFRPPPPTPTPAPPLCALSFSLPSMSRSHPRTSASISSQVKPKSFSAFSSRSFLLLLFLLPHLLLTTLTPPCAPHYSRSLSLRLNSQRFTTAYYSLLTTHYSLPLSLTTHYRRR